MLKRTNIFVAVLGLASIVMVFGAAPISGTAPSNQTARQNARDQNQATAAPNNARSTATPANPSNTNLQNAANNANGVPNQTFNNGVANPGQVNNATALTGSGVLNSVGGTVYTQQMLARLQMDATNRKTVTLTGRITDLQSFLMGGILGSTAPDIVGQPISANQNLNQNPIVNGANPGTQNTATVAPNANAVNQSVATARPNGPPSLNVPNQNPTLTPGTPGNIPSIAQGGNTGLANANMAGQVSNFGQMMVLQTNNGALLVAQDPLAVSSIPVSATATPVTVQGRIYERGGIRMILVSTINVPNAPQNTNNNATNQTLNNSNGTNINTNNNNSKNQTIPRTNRQTR